MRNDLCCSGCAEKEATHLVYREKYYPDCAKTAIFDPHILCIDCLKHRDHEWTFVPFINIAEWNVTALGALLSKRGREFNALNNKFWRKRLWRVRYIYSNK